MPGPAPAAAGQGLRLLHVVSTARRRGAEIFASDLIRALTDTGLHQRVAILRGTEPLDLTYAVPGTVLSPEGGRRPSLTSMRIVRDLRGEIRRWAPDVVQVHGGDALKYSVAATLGRRTPLVYRNIGLAAPWARKGARRRMYSVMMRRAAMVVAVADVVAQEVVDRFDVPPELVRTVPNAVDPGRIDPQHDRRHMRRALGIPDDAPVALSLAALTWEKDPHTHVEIAERVLTLRSQAFHLLAGDGPMRTAVEEEVRRRGLEGRVLVLGQRDDVADLLGASDALLFASRSDGMEGMPAVVIEAGMAGVPVVAYDVAGVSEVVLHGVTGLLAPEGDVGALATALDTVLGDDEVRGMLARRARQRCLANFDVKAQAERYIEVYRDVVVR